MNKNIQRGLILAGVLLAPSAFATAPTTVEELATNVSFADLKTGMLTLFGSMATIAVVILGGGMLLSKLGWRR